MADVVEAPATPEVVAAPAPAKEHWKTRQKRLAAEAAARGESAEAIEAQATPVASGFLSWDEFCNRVAVDLVTSQFGFTMLTNYAVGEASQVFFARMELAYKAMKDAHGRGASKGL